jgi:hypothetical protein
MTRRSRRISAISPIDTGELALILTIIGLAFYCVGFGARWV